MKKMRIFLLFLSIGIIYLLVSCRDEIFFPAGEKEVKTSLTVEKAKAIFERTISGLKTRSDADSLK